MKNKFLFLVGVLVCFTAYTQQLNYAYPVRYITLTIEQQPVKMACMDVPAAKPNGKTVLLLHGKNFNGYYWKEVITGLNSHGYRVVVPDQVGWGFSDKPVIHYSFHLLAANTKSLLDTLGVAKVHVIGHSMGGMLATRFALMYPAMVDRIIFENPIGLEDYRTFVPYQSLDSLVAKEERATYASLKRYQQTYYPEWKPEYEQYVAAQWAALQLPGFAAASKASAITYQMIYEQPVVYEFKNIQQQALIIIGQEDRTVVGKDQLPKQAAARYGNYPALGKWLQRQIKNSKLVEMQDVGHIPHVQVVKAFMDAVIGFLR